jgi:hypothetical protein
VGVGTAILGKKKGYCFLCLILEDKYKKDLIDNIEWEEEGHTDLILNATVVMKPGIPDKASIVKKLVEKAVIVVK